MNDPLNGVLQEGLASFEQYQQQGEMLDSVTKLREEIVGSPIPSNTKPNDPLSNYLKTAKPNLTASQWLEIGKVKGREKAKETANTTNSIIGIATGQAEQEIRSSMKETEGQILKLIDSLGQAYTVPTESSVSQAIGEDIRRMENSLINGDYAKQTNPLTQQPYTAEEWKRQIRNAKESRYVEAGVTQSPYDAGATILMQLLFPDQAQDIMFAPEQLRKQRYEMTKDAAVRNFQAQREKSTALLNYYGSKYNELSDLAVKERDWTERKNLAIWESNQATERFNKQLENGNWEAALKESNDILQNLRNLPPEQIEAAMLRYNNLAGFANRLNNLGMKEYTPDEIKAVVKEGKLRERDRIITQVVNQMLVQRNNWETATAEDISKFNQYLKAFGPQLDPNSGTEKVLTVSDLPIVTAFNRLKPRTEESKRSNQQNEQIRRENIQSRERMNTQDNQTSRANAAAKGSSKPDKADEALKKLEDEVREKQILFDGAKSDLTTKAGKDLNKLSMYEKSRKFKAEWTAYTKSQQDLKKAQAALEARSKPQTKTVPIWDWAKNVAGKLGYKKTKSGNQYRKVK